MFMSKNNNKNLNLNHLAPYPMGDDDGLLIKTNTRRSTESGINIGYKVGNLIGVSARSGVEILLDKDEFSVDYDLNEIKPILRPLSDLEKEIIFNGKNFIPIAKIHEMFFHFGFDDNNFTTIRYNIWFQKYEPLFGKYLVVETLFTWHFDVFNLIDDNLAIDLNTIDINNGLTLEQE